MYDLFEKTSALQLRFHHETLLIEYHACAANAKRVHSITSKEPYTFSAFEDVISTSHRQSRGFDCDDSNGDNMEAVLTSFSFNGHCNLCKNCEHKETDYMAKDLINPTQTESQTRTRRSVC